MLAQGAGPSCYASASELADELERYVRGEPILARPVGNLERTAKSGPPQPGGRYAMMTAILLLLVGGSAGAHVKYQEAKGTRGALAKKNEQAGQVLEQEQEAVKQAKIAKEAAGEKDIALKDLEV